MVIDTVIIAEVEDGGVFRGRLNPEMRGATQGCAVVMVTTPPFLHKWKRGRVMLLLLIGWVVLACLLALLIGSAIHQGAALSDAPAHVSNRHWQQVTERHVPMGTFRRVQ
jgi:hypothetical protein